MRDAMSDAPNNLKSETDIIVDREGTALQQCVHAELRDYFELLDGETPSSLHKLVMSQVESALLDYVMQECRGNQSRAAQWLGISRGTLRSKLTGHCGTITT